MQRLILVLDEFRPFDDGFGRGEEYLEQPVHLFARHRLDRKADFCCVGEKSWILHGHIPTVAEFVAGYEASQWYGIVAPKNTPNEIVEKINRQVNATLADSQMSVRFGQLGGTPLRLSPPEFGKLIADETGKWAKVVRFAGLKS